MATQQQTPGPGRTEAGGGKAAGVRVAEGKGDAPVVENPLSSPETLEPARELARQMVAAEPEIYREAARTGPAGQAGQAGQGPGGGGATDPSLEDRTVDELRALAAERAIAGRSSMRKQELIDALRDEAS